MKWELVDQTQTANYNVAVEQFVVEISGKLYIVAAPDISLKERRGKTLTVANKWHRRYVGKANIASVRELLDIRRWLDERLREVDAVLFLILEKGNYDTKLKVYTNALSRFGFEPVKASDSWYSGYCQGRCSDYLFCRGSVSRKDRKKLFYKLLILSDE